MLTELHTIAVEQELHDIYEQLVTTCNTMNVLCEDVNIPDVPDTMIQSLVDIMADAEKRYAAAKKGLSLVSKLKAGPERSKHFSRILSNMNKLRAYNNKINKSVERLTQK